MVKPRRLRLAPIPAHWRLPLAGLVVAGLAAGGLWLWQARHAAMEARILSVPAADVMTHKDLVAFASSEAKPLFARDCAQCHGADMKGKPGTGAPNLTDKVWLYGRGVFQVERDILYGLRSGRQKANDLTEMPAYGQRGQLTDTEIKNVVQYILQISGRPNDPVAAQAGLEVYNGHGQCYDCHTADGKGNIDYGATDLTANVWDYGGDPHSLYETIYFGRHGVMPAWIGKLSLAQIRALAIYVNAAAQR